MRRLGALGVDAILVCSLRAPGPGLALDDRLTRAAGERAIRAGPTPERLSGRAVAWQGAQPGAPNQVARASRSPRPTGRCGSSAVPTQAT